VRGDQPAAAAPKAPAVPPGPPKPREGKAPALPRRQDVAKIPGAAIQQPAGVQRRPAPAAAEPEQAAEDAAAILPVEPSVEAAPVSEHRWMLVVSTLAALAAIAVVVFIVVLRFNSEPNEDQRPSAGQAPPGNTATSTPANDQPIKGVVPEGWQEYLDPQFGWSIAVPASWEPVQDRAGRVAFRDPTTGAFARVDRGESATQPPANEAQRAERTYQNRSYKRIKLSTEPFKGHDAAEWEFTYQNGGSRQHATDLYLIAKGDVYDLSFQSPEPTWETVRPLLAQIRNSFSIG
jgi:hypothetical protein